MSIVAIDERIENLSGVSWHSTEVHNRENGERFVKSEFVMDDGGFYTLSLLYESLADKYPIGRHIMALCNVDGFLKVDKCVNITKSLLGKDFELFDVTSAPDNTVIMNFIGVEKITHDFITPENNGKLIIEKISCFIDELNEKAQKLVDQFNRDGDLLVYVNPTLSYGDLVTVELGFDSIPGLCTERHQKIEFSLKENGINIPMKEGCIKADRSNYKLEMSIVDYA